jgi:spermidine synthase
MDAFHNDEPQGSSRSPAAETRPQRPALSGASFAFVCTLFLLSGAAALIYEISWMRQIGGLLGQSISAAAIVLAAYFLGLAAGYALGARLVRRIHPLNGYAGAELIASAWAFMIPLLLEYASRPAFVRALGSIHQADAAVVQGLASLLLLLPSTVALGATLPFLAEFVASHGQFSMHRPVIAYAWNTFGALLGVIAATTVLLVAVGVTRSSFLAAGISSFCAVAALWLRRTDRFDAGTELRRTLNKGEPEKQAEASPPFRGRHISGAWMAALIGFATLGLQVLYMRLFALVFHNSTYSFGIVVAVFLASLTLGAAAAPWLVRRCTAHRTLTGAAWAAAMATAASVWLFVRWTELDYFTRGRSFTGYLAACFALVTCIVLPPVTLSGVILPSLWQANADNGSAGRTVGRLTMVNTVAAAIGSLAVSFLLLPAFGLERSFATIIALLGAAAVLLCLQQRSIVRASLCAATVIGAAIPLCSPQGMMGWIERDSGEELVRRWHSSYGWIDVVRVSGTETLKVRQNLHYRFGATGGDSAREHRQAHLPLLLHPEPRQALFLGLGTGMTAAGALPHPEVKRITIVELIPEVVEAARLLREGNRNVVDASKTRIVVDDARHYLLATDREFDVIVSDLFVPWESETGYLYTVEHYQRCREALRPGGICCQWLPVYQLGAEEFRLIADTFASVFPESALWWGRLDPQRPIMALIGAERPLQIDRAELARRLSELQAMKLPYDPWLESPERMLDLVVGRWPRPSGEPLNTQEHPRLEFLAPLAHQDRRLLSGANFRRFFDHTLATLPDPGVSVDGSGFVPEGHQVRVQNQRLMLFGAEAAD